MARLSISSIILLLILVCASLSVFGQGSEENPLGSQEVSEEHGIPVILMHLPDWQNKQKEAVFIKNSDELRKALGEREIFNAIEFVGGAEAATANYPAGKLLLVEYGTPQASIDTDRLVKQKLDANTGEKVFYRRIGNYNVFVLDGKDEAAANTLLDQIKYEKVVRWLGRDPFIDRRAEQDFIRITTSLFIATVIVIVSGLGIAILIGLIAGFILSHIRSKKRLNMPAFSDGGGLTRLNLDELTPPIKLLKD